MSELLRDGVWGGCWGALLGGCNRRRRRTLLAAESGQLSFKVPGSTWKLQGSLKDWSGQELYSNASLR